MNDNYIGIDQGDFAPKLSPCDTCYGELGPACEGCEYYEEVDE